MNQKDHWDYTTMEWRLPEFHRILESAFAKPRPIVVDIGANVGAWGNIVLEDFPVETLYSFEPDDENFAFLEKKLTDKRCVNIRTGIFYGAKELEAMGKGDGNCGGYFVRGVRPFGSEGTPVRKTFQLEELEYYLIFPDLIKIDVEGAEKNIIEHSKIVKDAPALIVEWHYPAEDAQSFFATHLPKHKITENLEGIMFLLERYA